MTEAEHMAVDTWHAVYSWSMPAYAALDRVQDLTDDRTEAAQLLLDAAVNDFEQRRPHKLHDATIATVARTILIMLRNRQLIESETLWRNTIFLAAATRNMDDGEWHDWFYAIKRAISLCTELLACCDSATQAGSPQT